MSNEEKNKPIDPIDVQIHGRKWSWLEIGHTLRKSAIDITCQTLKWEPPREKETRSPQEQLEKKLRDRNVSEWAELG